MNAAKLGGSVLVIAGLILAGRGGDARAAGPVGDRYVCYQAKDSKIPSQPKLAPSAKNLADQLEVKLYDATKSVALCNPANVAGQGILNPAFHQEAYAIKLTKADPPQAKFVSSNHTVMDEFGTLLVATVKPDRLLVRSSKSDFGPVTKCKTDATCAGGDVCANGEECLPPPPITPPGVPPADVVDNFKCYKTKLQKGAPKSAPVANVSVSDQFGNRIYDVKKPTRLCTPVDKNGENPDAPTKPGHLMCYQAALSKTDPKQSALPSTKVLLVNGNFPDRYLDTGKVSELCVPAYKDFVPPTPTPSPVPTATPTVTATSSGPPCTQAQLTVNLTWTGPVAAAAGITLDYPESKLDIPGTGNAASVKARVANLTGVVGGFFDVGDINDPGNPGNPSLEDRLNVGLVVVPAAVPMGDFVRVTFDCRAGAPVPTLADFACAPDIGDENGTPFAGQACNLSLTTSP